MHAVCSCVDVAHLDVPSYVSSLSRCLDHLMSDGQTNPVYVWSSLSFSDACSVQLDLCPSRCPILCQQSVPMSCLMSGDPVKPVCTQGVNF